MPIAPPALVVGAARLPLPFGLFSTFTVRPGDGRWQTGTQWETGTCEPADGIGELDCATPASTVGLPKNLDGGPGSPGDASPFTVYGHYRCSPTGTGVDLAQERAQEHLLAREEARVEQALWTGDLGNVPALQAAGTVTLGGGAVSLVRGLGLLEEYLAAHYGSLGVIHATRGAALAAVAADAVTNTGPRLFTALGTPVAAGAGYPGSGPAGQAAAAGTSWLYATPALFGYRSEVFTSTNRQGDLLDRSTNDLYAVAERSYLLGFDPCGVAAVLVNLPS